RTPRQRGLLRPRRRGAAPVQAPPSSPALPEAELTQHPLPWRAGPPALQGRPPCPGGQPKRRTSRSTTSRIKDGVRPPKTPAERPCFFASTWKEWFAPPRLPHRRSHEQQLYQGYPPDVIIPPTKGSRHNGAATTTTMPAPPPQQRPPTQQWE